MSNFIPTPGNPMMAFVHKTVHEHIRKKPTISTELKVSLKHSDVLLKLIGNLTKQLGQVQELQIKRGKKKIADATLKSAIGDMTDHFLRGVEQHADTRRESEIAKIAKQVAESDQQDMDNTLAGNSSGVYEDMGLVVEETKVEEV